MTTETAKDILQRQIDVYKSRADNCNALIKQAEKEIKRQYDYIAEITSAAVDCGFMIGLLEREIKK